MEPDAMTNVLAALAGLFCLLAAGLLVGLVVFQRRRGQTLAAPPRPRGPGPGLPTANEDAYDEEAPTVIVNQPTRPAGKGPAQMASAPQARTSGATIIAFDDDDDD